jgi:hypothetical protein
VRLSASGAPLLQRDLPEVLNPVIDSYVEVALVAKGEPLTYQWFVQQDGQAEGVPIEGATQSFIFVSPSIQPHNEGVYYCEVVNRRGRAVSTRMTVRVVDDRVPPDPTRNFVVDRATVAPGAHTIRRLRASAGGSVRDSQTDAAMVCQPEFFVCMDRDGNDVSDTHGAEVAISRREDVEAKLRLPEGETLVSCLFDVLPRSMGSLLRPALLWIPHHLVAGTNTRVVVVEIDPTSGRVLRDVKHAVVEDEFARATIDRLGTFGVISRQNKQRNEDSSSDSVVERACLLLQHPATLSSSAASGKFKVSLALVRDLANCRGEAKAKLKAVAGGMDRRSTIASFQLSIRDHFSLSLQLGGVDRVAFRWPPPSREVVVAEIAISFDQLASLSPEEQPAFLQLPVRATVSKTPIQKRTQVHSVESRNHDAASNNEHPLFERDWEESIPFLHDSSKVFELAPPTPSVVERTGTRLVMDLTGSEAKHDEPKLVDEDADEDTPARRTDESEQCSPYFYVVEMAVFSPTFWRRYDQTWWFDKTKTNVIDGMYKVVHRGFGTNVSLSTSAYAGCVRVAWCSIDNFGTYSEPLLLTPLPSRGEPPSHNEANGTLANWSAEMKETWGRLQTLMEGQRIDDDMLHTVYGLPRPVKSATDVVVALLEAKTSLGSCNFELALLLSGFSALERQIKRIKIASGACMKLMGRFLRLQRAIPELERRPEVTLPITRRLHQLLQVSHSSATH